MMDGDGRRFKSFLTGRCGIVLERKGTYFWTVHYNNCSFCERFGSSFAWNGMVCF